MPFVNSLSQIPTEKQILLKLKKIIFGKYDICQRKQKCFSRRESIDFNYHLSVSSLHVLVNNKTVVLGQVRKERQGVSLQFDQKELLPSHASFLKAVDATPFLFIL